MTDKDYLERSSSAQQRLTQIREQIDSHVGREPRRADSPLIRPLLDRQQEIIGEISIIEREYWNA